MEKKQTKKVTIAAGAVTPKKKKKRYYPPKAKKAVVEKALEVKQPEPASFVWVEEKKPTWLQRVAAWLTSIGK